MPPLPTARSPRDLSGIVEETLGLLQGYAGEAAAQDPRLPARPLASLLEQCRREAEEIAAAERPQLSLILQMPGTGGAVAGLVAAAQPGVLLVEGADPFAAPGADLPARTDLIAIARRAPRPAGPAAAGAMFRAALRELGHQTNARGQSLVLRHVVPVGTGTVPPDLVPLLAADFRLRPVLVTRHPLDAYLSHQSAAGRHATTLEDYMARYLAMLADHPDWLRVSYEDLVADPQGVAPALLAALGLPHRPEWPDFYPFAARGQPVPEGRRDAGLGRGPQALPRRGVAPAIARALGDLPDYLRLCEIMGYDPTPGGEPSPDRDIALDSERFRAQLEAARGTGEIDDSAYQILKSEIDTLSHELSIAQARGMVGRGQRSGPGRLESFSQLGQDLWVLEKTIYRHGGYFVEFGATDGVLLSNTYLLERDFGWTGLCAEPNPAFFEKLRENRSCTLSPDCIGPRTGEKVRFVLADVYGGILAHAEEDHHAATRAAYAARGAEVELETISLDDFLRKYDAPQRIDYLSIDTEGSEYAILSKFPFRKWDIRLITVEHNFLPQRRQIHELLTSHGYRRIEKEWDDWYWKPDDEDGA